MSTKTLPERPNLAQLKLQAKELHALHRERRRAAAARIAAHHPRFAKAEAQSVLDASPPFRLADAQLVVAREYGFTSWGALKQFVEIGERVAKLTPHPRFDEEVFGDRHLRDDGAASAEVRRHKGANHTEARAAQAGGPALRAGRAQPVVAVGPVYVSPAAARTNLCRCVPGRSLPLPREPGDGASPKKRAGAGGVVARDRRLWGAAGDPDRSGPAVHRLARVDGVRSGVEASWHRACEEPAASPADLREDRAVLEDAVGGAALTHGVRRLRGLPTAGGALHPALQLPAAAPGAGGLDACGSVLPRRQPGAREHRGASGRERAAPGAGATAEKALLSCWPARGSHPLHQRERRGPQRAGGR